MYYLFYSANDYRSIDYAVGYATSNSPMGPWTKNENSPIIHRSIVGENGSGHGDIFTDKAGNYYYVYHVHASKTNVAPRKTRIIPLHMEKNESGIYDITVNGDEVIEPYQEIILKKQRMNLRNILSGIALLTRHTECACHRIHPCQRIGFHRIESPRKRSGTSSVGVP